MSDMNIDVFEMLDQALDGYVNNQLLEAAGERDKITYALIKLFNEYGIYGRKITEFMNKFQMLHEMFGDKEVKDNGTDNE